MTTTRRGSRPLRELGRHAGELGLELSLEMYEDTLLGSAASAVRLVQDIALDNVGLNPDLGNLFRLHRPIEDFQAAVLACAPVSNYWHIKSYLRDEDPGTGQVVSVPAPMESGSINYRAAVKAALDAGPCVEHYGGDGLSVSAANAITSTICSRSRPAGAPLSSPARKGRRDDDDARPGPGTAPDDVAGPARSARNRPGRGPRARRDGSAVYAPARSFEVRGFDVTPARRELAQDAGARGLLGRRGVCGRRRRARLGRDGAQLAAVLFDDDGAARASRQERRRRDVDRRQAAVTSAAVRLAERGIAAVDAPVSGGPVRAGAGNCSSWSVPPRGGRRCAPRARRDRGSAARRRRVGRPGAATRLSTSCCAGSRPRRQALALAPARPRPHQVVGCSGRRRGVASCSPTVARASPSSCAARSPSCGRDST